MAAMMLARSMRGGAASPSAPSVLHSSSALAGGSSDKRAMCRGLARDATGHRRHVGTGIRQAVRKKTD